jgi:hypothetical protein
MSIFADQYHPGIRVPMRGDEGGVCRVLANEYNCAHHVAYAYTVQQCCGSGMFIPDPDFYPSMIPDLRSRIQKQEQKREVKKKLLSYRFL